MKQVYVIHIILFLSLISCGGGDDSGGTPIPMTVADPTATTLVFPENNTECNEGVIVNDNFSRVTFRWNASENTDSYEVNLKNLDSDVTITASSNTAQAEMNVARGAPYEWFVISKANGTEVTASSSTFKFYNQGLGINNYAPFPAEVIAPSRGATIANTSSVTLEWKGSDVDDDIVGFEVLFGTENEPSEVVGTTAAETFEVTVASGQTYYWKIISTDAQNNSSSSEIFQFRIGS